MSSLYDVTVLNFSPITLGIPASRPRCYMILVRKGSLQWHPEVVSVGPAVVFNRIFSRALSAGGEIYLRAPEADLELHVEELAAKRGLAPHKASGRKWRCKQVLPYSQRRRIQLHLESSAPAHAAYPNIFCNLRQSPSFGSLSAVMPTLLRGSVIYSFQAERVLVAKEHFEVMGYRMFSEPTAGFAGALDGLSNCQLRGLAGNGMHLAAISSVLLFALAGTVRV